jgi:hypothetical protein
MTKWERGTKIQEQELLKENSSMDSWTFYIAATKIGHVSFG